jgi:AcrR family transcriptional regulator
MLDLRSSRSSALGRHARRRLRTRERLVDAGRRLMASRGPDAVPVAAITDEADVGVGSFYNYFHSKQELLDVVVAETTGLLGAVLERATRALPDPAERVATCVRRIVRLAGDDPTWAWFVLRASDALPRLAASVTAPIERHVRAGLATGRFTVEDPNVAVHAIGGALLHVMRARLLDRVGPHADRIAAEHVLRLLGLPASAAREVASRAAPAVAPGGDPRTWVSP